MVLTKARLLKHDFPVHGKKLAKKVPKIITSHDVLEPFKEVLSASRDVIISGQSCGSKLQRVFTLGDGCRLPNRQSF